MIRSITVLCAAVLLSASASMAAAQGRERAPEAPGPRGHAMEQRSGQGRGMAQMLLRDITLSSAQRDTIGKVSAAFQAGQRATMKDGARGARRDPAMMAERRALMVAHQQAVRALLTPEQRVTFDRNVETMQERRRGGGARDRMRPGARRGARRGT